MQILECIIFNVYVALFNKCTPKYFTDSLSLDMAITESFL